MYGTESLMVTYWDARLDRKGVISGSNGSDRTKALQMAADQINALNFQGSKTESTQTDEFPRTPDTSVPQDILDAAYEIAYEILDGRDIEIEREQLHNSSLSYSGTGLRKNQDPNLASDAVIHGIASEKAWAKLKPYLRDGYTFDIYRVS